MLLVAVLVQLTPNAQAVTDKSGSSAGAVDYSVSTTYTLDRATGICHVEQKFRFTGAGNTKGAATAAAETGKQLSIATTAQEVGDGWEVTWSQHPQTVVDGITQLVCDESSLAASSAAAVDWKAIGRGVLAAVVGSVIFISITLAATALAVAIFGPGGAFYGEIVGGCIGGAVSTFVVNKIQGVGLDANLGATAAQCIIGAVVAGSLGSLSQKLISSVGDFFHGPAADAVASAASGVSSSGAAALSGIEMDLVSMGDTVVARLQASLNP